MRVYAAKDSYVSLSASRGCDKTFNQHYPNADSDMHAEDGVTTIAPPVLSKASWQGMSLQFYFLKPDYPFEQLSDVLLCDAILLSSKSVCFVFKKETCQIYKSNFPPNPQFWRTNILKWNEIRCIQSDNIFMLNEIIIYTLTITYTSKIETANIQHVLDRTQQSIKISEKYKRK